MKRAQFIAMLGVYLLLFLSKKLEWYAPEIINSYLSDLLCMPIVLSLARYGVAYWKNDASLFLDLKHIIAATTAFIVFFEWLLPHQNSLYTADPADVLMYLYGAVIFYHLQPRQLTPHSFVDDHNDQ
jgi:hypothetical protein